MNILSFVSVSLPPYLDVDNHFLNAAVKYLSPELSAGGSSTVAVALCPPALHRALNPLPVCCHNVSLVSF